jgi:hypothetical protein
MASKGSGKHRAPAAARREALGGQPTLEEREAAAIMLRMISGIHVSQAVYLMAKLGIADALADGAKPVSQLARSAQADEASLYRVLRLLAALGVLTEHDGRSFSLTVLGDRLRRDAPASMRSWAMLHESVGGIRAFEPIVETVRTGKPGADIANGMGVFEFLDQHRELDRHFQAAMSERTTGFAPSVAARYDFAPLQTVADIGGGRGTLLATILQAHPHLHGILFDRPTVTAGARDALRAARVADRCKVVTGDFFQEVPAGADAYVVANVLHDWDDQRAMEILASIRRAMPADGRVLIVERLIAPDPADALPVLLSDMNMLVFTGGRERTNPEYGKLLAEADLALGTIQPVASPYGIIEGLASALAGPAAIAASS